jgi:hypothetical protein
MNDASKTSPSEERQLGTLTSHRLFGRKYYFNDQIPVDCSVVFDRDHPDSNSVKLVKPWTVTVSCMLDAIDFDTLHELFDVKGSDAELDVALRDSLIYFLKHLNSDKVDACSLMVGSLKRFLKSHPDFQNVFENLNDD